MSSPIITPSPLLFHATSAIEFQALSRASSSGVLEFFLGLQKRIEEELKKKVLEGGKETHVEVLLTLEERAVRSQLFTLLLNLYEPLGWRCWMSGRNEAEYYFVISC